MAEAQEGGKAETGGEVRGAEGRERRMAAERDEGLTEAEDREGRRAERGRVLKEAEG